MSIQITIAQPLEMKQIREVQRLSWLETYPNEELGILRSDIQKRFDNDDTPEGEQAMENRKKRFFQKNAITYVVKDRNKIVGYCLAIHDEKENRIQAIYLLNAYQGRGLGKQLIQKGINWLKDRNESLPIYLNVAEYNKPAIGFYEHIGFKKTGEILNDEFITLPSGQVMFEIEMKLQE